MLVGYEANNALRNASELGEFSRNLISMLADKHVHDYRALLFASRIKADYKGYYSSYTNVSTYLPTGSATLMPELWLRYRLNPWLKAEKVKVFHGLNEELPFHISRDIKTIITCFGTESHHVTSLPDMLFWRSRMRYAYSASDVVVAVSDEVREQLVRMGVDEQKIVVIGVPGRPFEVTDEMADQYYELYASLKK
ncbi:MAG: glycosyltransferase [Bacteroidales bacterium]|nr:glycosyltransferase [Bacteroidales bacterium]